MGNVQMLLRQHVGAPCAPCVEVGAEVKKGTLIATPTGLGANIFSSVYGKVTEITEDRIIIEPSGVGKLSDVMKAVQKVVDAEANVVLNSHITVADAQRAKMYLKNFGEFYRNQIEFASAVILSRSQNVKEDKLEKAVKLLRCLNDKCPIMTTP